ncbi:Na+/H+ antiporter subunit E [Salinisphaera sp. T31B1]|uniref:Na+/H+ antiporter subunit E n=1 Tax=Salinisphaera sp. T31B1 TaxID=727963 RepID=UPI0033413625
MRYLLGLIVGLATLWLLLSGHYSPMVLSLGAGSCLFTAFVCHRMGLIDAETVPLHLIARLPGYLFWLAVEIAKSNWDVAKRVILPGRHISPTMVTLRARQRSELGQTIFANSITLTPGTVTVGLRRGVVEVHALTEDNARNMEGGEMDQRVRALEGRSASTRAGR